MALFASDTFFHSTQHASCRLRRGWGGLGQTYQCSASVDEHHFTGCEAAFVFDDHLNAMLHLMRLPWINMAGQFRSFQWDPVLIIAQIVAMVSLWYFNLGLWVFTLDVIGKFDLSTEQMFTQSVSSVDLHTGNKPFY
ncbi:protein sys1 like protein [Plakobranchus ocellatus]|uniref:Protein sys1 like protein n=1 Tax=Plakobranchus ocellatus TaxID=259542 RepID=A0AAV4DU45_9GAST|nr:protein sys1 like protein [Plakobranchus ocellatus]